MPTKPPISKPAKGSASKPPKAPGTHKAAPARPFRWQELENLVKLVAEAKYGTTAHAAYVGGVKCDCVLDLKDGTVVVIEITKENTLEKLRTDIAKFNLIRPHYVSQNIVPKCYFITLDDPTTSLIDSGKAHFVAVMSYIQFFNSMLGATNYMSLRQRVAFGSAVDLYSGEPDSTKYVQVNYFAESGESYSVDRIANALIENRAVVLIGDYGSGKSRCVKEVFELLSQRSANRFTHPIAINLRDNWGLKRATEIITRHFTDLGLGNNVSDVLKVCFSKATTFLLDGFDEIGAQTWSDDPTKLVEIRRQSLAGVKDLITRAAAGILITGREHYFNDDAELLGCLGLDKKNPLILRCNQELSDSQFAEMIGYTPTVIPAWTPKKPLIATIIRGIERTSIEPILGTSEGQISFWNLLIDSFCERESRINSILDPAIIRKLYAQIGRLARTTKTPLGPISIKQINEAFEQATGRPPTDESAIILQRLPGLGRIGAESLDRQFVDAYILDGLKAEDVIDTLSSAGDQCLQVQWKNPIESFGAYYVAWQIEASQMMAAAVAFVRRHRTVKNRVFISDVLAALLNLEGVDIDMGGLRLEEGRFHHISLADTQLKNLHLEDCLFETLDITGASPGNVKLSNCVIVSLCGITALEHHPAWMEECAVQQYQSIKTLSSIRKAGLSTSQTFLLSSLRKLFWQPGGGRMEDSLFKGYGDSSSKRICDKIISLLVKEGFCQKVKGARGALYIPDRSKAGRVNSIMSQMTLSSDPIWIHATSIV